MILCARSTLSPCEQSTNPRSSREPENSTFFCLIVLFRCWLAEQANVNHMESTKEGEGGQKAIYIRTLKPSLNKDGGRYHLPRVWDNLLQSHMHKAHALNTNHQGSWLDGQRKLWILFQLCVVQKCLTFYININMVLTGTRCFPLVLAVRKSLSTGTRGLLLD